MILISIYFQELMRELNLDFEFGLEKGPERSRNCTTTLPHISKALDDVASLVELIDAE